MTGFIFKRKRPEFHVITGPNNNTYMLFSQNYRTKHSNQQEIVISLLMLSVPSNTTSVKMGRKAML